MIPIENFLAAQNLTLSPCSRPAHTKYGYKCLYGLARLRPRDVNPLTQSPKNREATGPIRNIETFPLVHQGAPSIINSTGSPPAQVIADANRGSE